MKKEAAYAAIANHHNSLIQARFTVAGLVLAANGFLVSAFFQSNASPSLRFFIPPFGILVALVCWLLEVRTYHILENLKFQGLALEKSLGLDKDGLGFFSLMHHQYTQVPPRLIPSKTPVPENSALRGLITHSVGIFLLYLFVFVFWLIMFFMFLMGA